MKTLFYLRVLCGGVLLYICAAGLPLGMTLCQAGEQPAAVSYVEGIEALKAGDFNKAAADFARATAGDSDNADYLRARGVAGVLMEKFQQAIADLERVMNLQPNDSEAKLWLAAGYRMSGDPARGSQIFSFNSEVPHNYADMIYNGLAMDYWSSRTNGSYYDREQKRQVQVNSPVKKLFPDAARAYAERHLAAGAEANKFVIERMKAELGRGEWLAAWNDLAVLRRTVPDDAGLRSDAAQCLLGLGDALHAREEFTHVLCIMPLWSEGYLGRARAAAILGDSRRADADLNAAKSLKAGGISAAEKDVHKAEAALPSGSAVEAFPQRVLSNASWDDEVGAALALHRQFNAKRLRYDEAYQDRIFAASDAIRVDEKNADRHEVLARFLYNHRIVPTIWNGPRAVEQLRPQSVAEHNMEMQRALASADNALKINPRHASALTTKGFILYTIGRPGDAEKLADKALEVEPRNARALALKEQILEDRAAELSAQAAALRSGHTTTTTEQRSDGEYEVTTHYPPTAEELAQAARCEAEAAKYRDQAARLKDEADRVLHQIIPDLLKKGKAQEAAALDPDLDEVNRALAEWAGKRHDTCAQKMYALMAEPMQHTTAAPELKTAWENILRTAWKEANGNLDAAAKIDPADGRIFAYRSVIAAAHQNAVDASRYRTAALALEEARARLMGTSFFSADKNPLKVEEAGLTLITRERQGEVLTAEGQNDGALAAFQANKNIAERVDKEFLWMRLPTAMLPDPSAGINTVQEAPTLASLMAWSRLGSARALLALNRPEEAQKEFVLVRTYLANWPKTAENRESMNVADSWARLGIAEAAMAAKNYDEAFQLLMSGEGWPWGLPSDLEARKNALTNQLQAARGKVEYDRMEADRRMTPEQRIERSRQADNDQFQKQRDQIANELQDPSLRPQDRRALESSLAELDRMIAMRKKTS